MFKVVIESSKNKLFSRNTSVKAKRPAVTKPFRISKDLQKKLNIIYGRGK